MNAGLAPLPAMLLAVLCSTFLGWSMAWSSSVGSAVLHRHAGDHARLSWIARGIGGSDFANFTESRPFLFGLLERTDHCPEPAFRGGTNFRISIIWFVVIAVIMSWVLNRTRFGNWLFATGGNPGARWSRCAGQAVKTDGLHVGRAAWWAWPA